MTRSAILLVAFVCLVNSCAEVKKTHQLKPSPSAIPKLHITNDTTATALTISMLDIKTDVAANIAITTFDIRFYNPNDKVLEGEFEFPLADGQQITRYALDMNGSLREGVVVEKAKARVAFENTVRRNIDPGLVEKTKGNNFRTRIYPLPAKGYRRIVIAVEQTLELQDNDLLYQLPLYADRPIDTFSLKITVIKTSEKPQLDANGVPLKISKQKENYTGGFDENNFVANKTIALVLPGSGKADDLVLTENHNGQTYFYFNSRVAAQYDNKKKPSSIGLLWDISASGQQRDLKKETGLLKQYLSALGNISVSLIPFNIFPQDKEVFTINGDAAPLINRIENLNYDGGTQLGAIDLSQYKFDEILMFTDGLSTFGKQEMVVGSSPVIPITTSPSADYSYLKFIALQTHGKFIDLGKLEPGTALKELNGESLHIINVIYNHSEISDLVLPTTSILNTGLSFAGKLNSSSADVKLELGFGNKVIETREITISKNRENDFDQLKRIWAGMRIAQLDMQFEKNRDEITKLGKEFSVVTQATSLLVLDRVEDYVQYEIVPPPDLQAEYYSLLKEKQKSKEDEKEMAFTQALDAMKKLKQWWKKDYAAKKPVPKTEAIQFAPPVVANDTGAIQPEASGDAMLNSGDSIRIADTSLVYMHSDSLTYQYDITGVGSVSSVGNSFSSSYSIGNNGNGDGVADRFEEKNKESARDIQLNEWKSDAAYLKTLDQTPVTERLKKYLELKKQYNSQPSFFVDVARLFIEKNDRKTGILVLSNISEMKLESAELSRIVAHQLMDAGEKELAIETFKQILKMREEDPQSYRDLALAYNETGEYNKAVELLYQLITGTWDARFGDVKAIALNEMNAIISAHKESVTTAGIDSRLLYAMPVDVRIVIGWSSDNSDIDLWVTDPTKEKCFYSNTETMIGGRISRDVTQGYGPEEFLLKKALNGNYVVDVNLFGDRRQTLGGPIAITADLFTDFGKPTQKRKTINFRVTTNKQVINLGSLKFGS